MPLNVADLADSLNDLFDGTGGYPASDDEAGQRWAKIYRTYAAAALAGPTAPLDASLEAAEGKLAGALSAAFKAANEAGVAGVVTLTPLVVTALAAFWLQPPVAFVTPSPPAPSTIAGVVTVAVPGVLPAGLAGVLAAGTAEGATTSGQAQATAATLDSWTRTVLVVNTPLIPPGPPAPPIGLT